MKPNPKEEKALRQFVSGDTTRTHLATWCVSRRLTPCPKCGTMLYAGTREDSTNEYHSSERCRDVLHAKLEEAMKVVTQARNVSPRHCGATMVLEECVKAFDAALERLRSHGK